MKKLITLLLIMATMTSMIACAKNNGGSGSSSSTTTAPGTTEIVEPTYDNVSFRISMSTGSNCEFYEYEDSDDPIKSALYHRNATVQDKYGVVITPVYTEATGLYGHVEEITEAVMTDSDRYDLTSTMAVSSGQLLMSGVLLDWNSLPYTDLSKSYWISSINDNFEIDGHIYNAVGDTNLTALKYTYCMFFNTSAAENIQVGMTDEVIGKVKNDQWTIDYFNSLVAGVYEDIDDTNGRSGGDFYGFQAENMTNLDTYTFAFDIPLVKQTDDDSLLELAYSVERTSVAVDKILQLYWENVGTQIQNTDAFAHMHYFIHGTALFATSWLDYCFTGLTSMEDDYIVLPYPMLDEEQGGYYTGMMDNYCVLSVPLIVPDPEMVSVITEALNREAEKQVYPVYYEESLKKKYLNDPDIIQLLDLVMEGRRADFGTLFQKQLSGISMGFRYCVNAKENRFAEYYDALSLNMSDQLKMIVTEYRANAD